MPAYRPDRVTKLLTALLSFAYFAMLAIAALVLVAAPVAKLLAGHDPNWTWGLPVPASVDSSTPVVTSWGPARLVVDDVRAQVHMPIGMLPWSLFALLWTHAAAAAGLMVLSLYQLRRIFMRVREGAPFDADNARRLRWLGLSLLGLALLNGVAEFATSLAVRRGLPATNVTVPVAPAVDMSLVFAACVLMALANIFHRGADLEQDHSLVI